MRFAALAPGAGAVAAPPAGRRWPGPGAQLILLSMALIALLRGELLDTWQNQLPKDAPNYFALNILPADKEAFGAHLMTLQARAAPLHRSNSGAPDQHQRRAVQDIVSKDSSGDKAIQRDLSLTWAADLPAENQLTAGSWWGEARRRCARCFSGRPKSAKASMASGDLMTASPLPGSIAKRGSAVCAASTGQHSQLFHDFFQPGTSTVSPATYLTSFYLAPGHDKEIIELSRTFPAVTILPIDTLLEQLRSILAQVTICRGIR